MYYAWIGWRKKKKTFSKIVRRAKDIAAPTKFQNSQERSAEFPGAPTLQHTPDQAYRLKNRFLSLFFSPPSIRVNNIIRINHVEVGTVILEGGKVRFARGPTALFYSHPVRTRIMLYVACVYIRPRTRPRSLRILLLCSFDFVFFSFSKLLVSARTLTLVAHRDTDGRAARRQFRTRIYSSRSRYSHRIVVYYIAATRRVLTVASVYNTGTA